jgi:Tol biopolymer transport system component/predicted Ser/Thr protein kinase
MSLAPGTLLGPYEILGLLGAGGMGEVYKARDTRLDRIVALKVVKPAFAQRFEREAKTVASLNHPHICALYDVGPNYLIMEYVEGQTLDALILKHGMRLSDALRIASQVADGLSRAHAAGVIHRDLKPSNVMVTPDGTAKILDFGLAKTALPDAAVAEETATVTEQGTIVGTVAYMSPEQAEGRKLDGRSDIFSFGAMLYEMITGRRAFHGDSKVSTLAAILHTDPKAPESIPPQVDQIIRRCLRKDPARRWQAAADLKVALDDAREEAISGVVAASAASRPASRTLWRWVSIALAVAACAAGVGWWWSARSGAPSPGPEFTRITSDSGLATDPAISPDGKLVAYASDRAGEGSTDIWVQQIAGGQPIRITRHPANELAPAFSPDSSRIAFRSDRDGGGIYVVSALGGEERLVARHGHAPQFSPDGQWIAYRRGEEGGVGGLRMIDLVPAAGGAARELSTPVTGVLAPIWAPDSKAVLVSGFRPAKPPATCLLSVDAGNPQCTEATPGLTFPYPPVAWLPGFLYYTQRAGESVDLYRTPISAAGLVHGNAERLTAGTAQALTAAIRQEVNGKPLIALAALSDNPDIWAIAADTNRGTVSGSPVRITTSPAVEFRVFALSDPDRIGFLRQASQGVSHLLIRNLRTGAESEFLQNDNPLMTLNGDGTKAAYMKNSKIYVVSPPDPAPQQVSDERGLPQDWTRDSRYILLSPFETTGGPNTKRVRLVDVAARKTTLLTQHPKWPMHPTRFSPDGHWFLLFGTNTAVTRQIFVVPFRTNGEVSQNEWVPVTEGKALDREPRWSPDGNMVYFLSERDGFRCIWAQRLEPVSKKPSGDAFPVFHAHSARPSLDVGTDTYLNGLTVTAERIYVTMTERTGNIWLARWR